MAGQTYLPTRDQDLLAFATNMNAKIAASPGQWGLTDTQTAVFNTLVTTFTAAMATLQDPMMQAPPYVQAKNDARRLLIEDANGIRKLVDIIQAYPDTTNEMRTEINITIRDTTPTPIAPPLTKPNAKITSVNDNTVYFYLRDSAEPDHRSRPTGVASAKVITWIGEDPPLDFSEWGNGTVVSKLEGSVSVPINSPALSKVWIRACWMNAKNQTGPFGPAVWTNLAGGVAAQAA